MSRRVHFSIGILLAAMLFAGCSININSSDSQEEYSEDFSLYVPVASYSGFSVNNVNGTVSITGVDGLDQVEITGQKIVRDETRAGAKSHVGDISIDILTTGSTLNVRTTQPNSSNGRTYEVDYEIRVPREWKVSVTDVNGTVQVADVTNSVDVILTNGTLSTSDITGDLRASLTNGNIDGDITLLASSLCDLATTNGNIVLAVPSTTSATVSASVVNGSVSIANLSVVVSSSSRTHINGTLGKGEAKISLSAVNGNIHLRGL